MAKQLTMEGTFHGTVLSSALGKSSKGTLQVVLKLHAFERYYEEGECGVAKADFYDIAANGQDGEIMAYLYPIKSDGTTNEGTAKDLLAVFESFGSTGDLSVFNGDSVVGERVQFVAKNDTYNGKTSLKVDFLRAFGSSVGLKKMDESEAKQVGKQYATMFRALAPKTAAPKPTPAANVQPVGRPAAPPDLEPTGTDASGDIPF